MHNGDIDNKYNDTEIIFRRPTSTRPWETLYNQPIHLRTITAYVASIKICSEGFKWE